MTRIFSGIQPSGIPTLGNYLGAIRNWVKLQDDHECLWCVVDLHAITVFQNPKELVQQTREMAAVLLACGVDPHKHILFLQSNVRAHAQLAWIFNCVARLGWLNRMPQFKDKAGKDRENASVGLYASPNLLDADSHDYHPPREPGGRPAGLACPPPGCRAGRSPGAPVWRRHPAPTNRVRPPNCRARECRTPAPAGPGRASEAAAAARSRLRARRGGG